MGRLTSEYGVIPLFEPLDLAAGGDSETIDMSQFNEVDIILVTGVLTVPGVLTLYSGATAGAKTTALPFTYRLSAADFKAVAADTWGADTAETDGILTLSATANDHRTIVISVTAAAVAANGAGHRWVTANLASGTSQFVTAIAIGRPARYQPSVSAVPAV